MKTIREFEHGGSVYTIKAILIDGVWQVRVFRDGNPVGEPSTISDETAGDAQAAGHDPFDIMADELEGQVRK
ncbi:hypothetical protein [Paracoccus saliphilus]|uniref:Uncharacterized protein n=1 Tax=Paracoccus saliphilus TaxID=405559 RepID=A0ABY7SDL9_9RHOB|nr:hypothetical protein [Paracoccus saliphilus]WCR04990.1 hypothetical protein JHX88_09910 [Paracoccus saliphilus]